MTDKMRAEFEAAYRNEALHGSCGNGSFDEAVFSMRDGQYIIGMVQAAWWGWQASRAALVVELPEKISQHNTDENGFVNPAAAEHDEAIDDCRIAIESAGVRVKP